MVVVVLGQQLSKDGIHSQLRTRLEAGLTAFRSTNASYLLCSGGRTNEAIPRTEGAVMGEWARERGIDPDRILVEDRSLDTIGNAYFTRRLVDDLTDTPDTITLVTAEYHMDRAAYIFEQCFGDDYRLDTSFAVETTAADRQAHEDRSRQQAQTFFDPISPGNIEAIGQRLNDVHEYYDLRPTISAQ
ncbi:YdcF family protein [Halomontanus rarus]|uniref:YdcF family protein n=1 Tax=Halomontanus rarus TaxID=3034020 RepID=UPI00307C1D21